MRVHTYEEELVSRIPVVRGVENLDPFQNDRMGIRETAYAIMAYQGFEAEAEFGVSLNPTGESRSSARCLEREDMSTAYLIA